MLDPVGSTSWHNRHLDSFRVLDELINEAGLSKARVMIVGPGGVTRLARPFLNDSNADHHIVRKLIGDAARYSDQLLRRIPFTRLCSLEPFELTKTLSIPHELIVVDRSMRVLRAIERDMPNAVCHCVDLSIEDLPATADIVVAFNIISRLEGHAADGLRRLVQAVAAGGWLQIDDRSANEHLGAYPEFTKVASKTFRKEAVSL